MAAPPPRFKHFVITLFNLKLWKTNKHQAPTQTEDWLKQRFHLFETYCLPSMQAQTANDFIWLCLFDKDTPESYKRRITTYGEKVPQFRACYFSAADTAEFLSGDNARHCLFIRQAVASFLSADDEYVLTTNVDNDDAIHKDMLACLQQHFRQNPQEMLYSLNYGIQYLPRLKAVIRMRYPHNHFLTLSERRDKDFRTIEFYSHATARKLLPVTDILERPYWLEVVHGANVSNDLRITTRVGYKLCLRSFSLSEFGIPLTFSFGRNLLNAFIVLPAYFLKIAIWRIGRKWKKRKARSDAR